MDMSEQDSVGLRILVFDHFYHQDIAALREGLADSDELVAFSYRRLHRVAQKSFPAEAFRGVKSAMRPEFEAAHKQWKPVAATFARWMIAAYQPTVFVVPSDIFFYLRPVISTLKLHGVPTVVVQKETTISPLTMVEHSEEIRTTVPFMSDLMTVCSDRHREFWLNCGADPDLVLVTGQPRFDLYSAPRPQRAAGARPKLLYLSYDDTAYLPPELDGDSPLSWRILRHETEDVLATLTDRYDITVKEHPQQRNPQDWLGSHVTRTERRDDTRRLIAEADLVVGFQTTTLFEAALAKKPILYAAWGDAYQHARHELVPFEDEHGMLTHVQSAEHLEQLLRQPLDELSRPTAESLAAVAEHLGPTNGGATQRVLGHLHRVVADEGPAQAPERPPIQDLVSGLAGGLVAPLGRLAANVVARANDNAGSALSRRSAEFAQRGVEARRAI